MSEIRVTCGDCRNDLDLTEHDITLIVDKDGRMPSTYRFNCSDEAHEDNGYVTIKPLTGKAMELFETDCEIRAYESALAAEDFENQREISEKFGPITDDEQIDFHKIGHEALALIVAEELSTQNN